MFPRGHLDVYNGHLIQLQFDGLLNRGAEPRRGYANFVASDRKSIQVIETRVICFGGVHGAAIRILRGHFRVGNAAA